MKPLRPSTPFFNAWRTPLTNRARTVIDTAVSRALAHEDTECLRGRRRGAAEQEAFKAAATALLADATYRYLQGTLYYQISRSHRVLDKESRYRSNLSGRQIITALDLLSDPRVALLQHRPADRFRFGGPASRTAAGPALIQLVGHLSLFDFGTRLGEEVIVSRGEKRGTLPSEFVEYTDTALTHSLRDQVRRINSSLASLTLGLPPAGAFIVPHKVDPRDILVKRYFTRKSFESGGRIFDSWFMSSPKAFKLRCTINGESVVSLDYDTCLVRLAYAAAGATLPTGDGYAIEGLPRPVAKRLFAACLFVSKDGRPLTRWPEGMQVMAKGISFTAALHALQEKHPALIPIQFKGVGHSLQFTESNILVDVLLQLIDKGIPAMPVHDCVIVPRSHLSATKVVMQEAFTRHTGLPSSVTEEFSE